MGLGVRAEEFCQGLEMGIGVCLTLLWVTVLRNFSAGFV